MAEVVLSSLIPVLFEKLSDAALKSIARHKGIDGEIKKWERSLTQIQGVLADASQKEITSAPVKRWLNDLQHLAYDIDDVLDGWLTEAMQSDSNHESEGIASKVRKLIPTCCTKFSRTATVLAELDDISIKLQDLVKEKTDLGLVVKEDQSRPRNNNRRFQSSVFDLSNIVGRQAEKEALIQQLLLPADETCDKNYSIVPIVGMGGVGKTTLARLLYGDKQVKDHFELKAWVCVSDEFDSFAISKVIFQSMAGINKDFADINLLQEDLINRLQGKKFLLVLDDVWSDSFEDWKSLVGPFHACAPGSKIIVTTRNDQLLKKLGYGHLSQLRGMPYDDALSLFLQALGMHNFDAHLSLKPHGEAIVRKCDGLPLALIALGTTLRTKVDEDSWKGVLESEIWKVEGEIIPALRLSYHDLSGPLKQLFAYCSLFPKDFLFDKEELVLLWMAEGFLHQPTPSDPTEEHLGHEYFDELLSRSFFQQAPNNESLFVMHDLMNDLATSVATEFILRVDNEKKKNIRKDMLVRYHHMSFVREKYVAYKKFEFVERAKSLRTFLALSVGDIGEWNKFYLSNKFLANLVCELPLLRVLNLSDFQISEIPDSIGTLKHLRYLNLSRTKIKKLPEEVCNLYNLQSLIISGCHTLVKLPNNFLKLTKLRHLDIRDTPVLNHLPLGIGELKSLQTLSKIVIGSERGIEIVKLKDFNNLCGKVSIVGLENVQTAIDARVANFSQKRLTELELVWNEPSRLRNAILEKEVLNELEPRNDKLIQLKIRSYGGLEFPKWVGHPVFCNLKHVSIIDCKRCTSLPPLAQLPSLKELFIKSLYGMEFVGCELHGAGNGFRSLEILCFDDMCGWKKWSGVVFPRLQKLQIYGCPNLVEVTLEALPSLNVLEIKECPKLVEVSLGELLSLNVLEFSKIDGAVLRRLVETASAVTKLEIKEISGLNDVAWRGVIEYLREVEDLSIKYCNEIRYLVQSDAVASKILGRLRKLELFGCDNLVSIGDKEDEDNCRSNLLPSLRILDVSFCKNIERCSCPDGVEELALYACSSMTVVSFPKGHKKLKSVRINHCTNLLEREWGEQKTDNNESSMPMLEYVDIKGWPNLKSVIKLNCLVYLTELRISDCENLESFPDNLKSLKKLEIEKCPKLDGFFLCDNFTSLEILKLINCPRLDASLPGWAWPPNLRSLSIERLKKPFSECGSQNFPISLVKLVLYGDGEDGVHSCSQISHLLPSSLTSLVIFGFEKLESISTGIQHLTSLQHLDFWDCPQLKKVSLHSRCLPSLNYLTFSDCPMMMDLSELLLPSLLRLNIWEDCPGLKEQCSKNDSHIPCISTSIEDF